jgi:8-oxo-dGDP phosphatase
VTGADERVNDLRRPREVRKRVERYAGKKWTLVTDWVHLDDGEEVVRDVVVHPGAVAIVALDSDDRIVLVRQYRHAVEADLWELPAGLLDQHGEPPLVAAQRELFEEAHLRADTWDLVLDVYTSSGMSSEVVRIYLARDLIDVPVDERFEQAEEEKGMPAVRVDLQEACELATSGRIHNAVTVAGVFAVSRAQGLGWSDLRSATQPLYRPQVDGPTAL